MKRHIDYIQDLIDHRQAAELCSSILAYGEDGYRRSRSFHRFLKMMEEDSGNSLKKLPAWQVF